VQSTSRKTTRWDDEGEDEWNQARDVSFKKLTGKITVIRLRAENQKKGEDLAVPSLI
jgi:hypothetical protein